MENRCGASFVCTETDIARGHRETVAFAHRTGSHDADAEIEVALCPGDRTELLIVLLAESRHRPALREQLGDDGGNAAEHVGAEAILESGNAERSGTIRIHRLRVRVPDQIDTLGRQFGNVLVPGTRVWAESSVGANWVGLTKIDTTTLSARRLASHTSEMRPSCNAPHGEDERDAGLSRAQGIEFAAESGEDASIARASWHFCSISQRKIAVSVFDLDGLATVLNKDETSRSAWLNTPVSTPPHQMQSRETRASK
jgi:hypothetical protein